MTAEIREEFESLREELGLRRGVCFGCLLVVGGKVPLQVFFFALGFRMFLIVFFVCFFALSAWAWKNPRNKNH